MSSNMLEKWQGTFLGLGLAAGIILLSLLSAFPLKWCWNYVMPHVSKGAIPEIGWAHAFCIMWVCRSLVKSNPTHSPK